MYQVHERSSEPIRRAGSLPCSGRLRPVMLFTEAYLSPARPSRASQRAAVGSYSLFRDRHSRRSCDTRVSTRLVLVERVGVALTYRTPDGTLYGTDRLPASVGRSPCRHLPLRRRLVSSPPAAPRLQTILPRVPITSVRSISLAANGERAGRATRCRYTEVGSSQRRRALPRQRAGARQVFWCLRNSLAGRG
jgi:hypothetical protein